MLKFHLWLTEHDCLGQTMLSCMSRIGSQNRNSLSMLPKNKIDGLFKQVQVAVKLFFKVQSQHKTHLPDSVFASI